MIYMLYFLAALTIFSGWLVLTLISHNPLMAAAVMALIVAARGS